MEFIARFHPVLVHLPIGVLLAALFLEVLSIKEKYRHLCMAVPVLLLAGAFSAVFSCITGYLLSGSGEYDSSLVSLHQWMGISLTGLSFLLYFRIARTRAAGKPTGRLNTVLTAIVLLLIFITGHLGGSLTHGPDYLTASFSGGAGRDNGRSGERDKGQNGERGKGRGSDTIAAAISNVQEAGAYDDIIRPLFQSHCYGCHGPAKQKGGLRMDGPDLLMKGGKDGVVIIPGKAEESELLKRLLLPEEDEHHMPPKGKKPLNDHQLDLIHWWIAQGGDFHRKVKELSQPEKIKPILLALQRGSGSSLSNAGSLSLNDSRSSSNSDPSRTDATPSRTGSDPSRTGADPSRTGSDPSGIASESALAGLPATPVEEADEKTIALLSSGGVVVTPVAHDSHYLMADFFAAAAGAATEKAPASAPLSRTFDSLLSLLPGLSKQLVSLDLSNTAITDKAMDIIGRCTNLISLNLSNTRLSDKGIASLASLHELRVLNLTGTSVTGTGILSLQPTLKKLRSLYLYRSKITPMDWKALQQRFPGVALDSGGYMLAHLPTDTAVVRRPASAKP